MTIKKRPTDYEFENWCENWDEGTHTDKLELCALYGISYDTGKHWRADHLEVPIKLKEKLVVNEPKEDVVGQILATKPIIDLDFVCFDIETSNLKADFSILLSAVIKPFKREPIVFRADNYDMWKVDRTNDIGICQDITEELSHHAVVVTHYGSGFDLPYLRAKMAYHGLAPLPPMFGVDTYRIAKHAFQVSSRRLQNLAVYFNLGKKGGVEGHLWMKAAYTDDRAALDEIVAHNITDCEILERLASVSMPYLKAMRRI